MNAPAMPAELLPCPFCGGPGEIRERLLIGYKELWYRVQCESCVSQTNEFRPVGAAVAMWNRRPALSRQEQPEQRHEQRVIGHVSGRQELMSTCVCGQTWPCKEGGRRGALSDDQRKGLTARIILNVCELPDYTSPEDQPNLLTCTVDELEACIERALEGVEIVEPPQDVRKITDFLEHRRIWGCVEKGKADCACYMCKQFRSAIDLISTLSRQSGRGGEKYCSRCRALEQGCNEANDRWQMAVADLGSALHYLYAETADYIRINKLGDVHHNTSMRMARDALIKHGRGMYVEPIAASPTKSEVARD